MSMSIDSVFHLLQFTDSQFPVGTFSFSNGLETAGFEKMVYDAETLREFVSSQAVQAAFTDGVAAIHAHRGFLKGKYNEIADADTYALEDKKMHFHGRYKSPVLITLKDGSKVIIGSSDPQALVDYINSKVS